jgi:hypothetical protein
VDYTEHGGGTADTESNGQYDGKARDRVLDEAPGTRAKLSPNLVHLLLQTTLSVIRARPPPWAQAPAKTIGQKSNGILRRLTAIPRRRSVSTVTGAAMLVELTELGQDGAAVLTS